MAENFCQLFLYSFRLSPCRAGSSLGIRSPPPPLRRLSVLLPCNLLSRSGFRRMTYHRGAFFVPGYNCFLPQRPLCLGPSFRYSLRSWLCGPFSLPRLLRQASGRRTFGGRTLGCRFSFRYFFPGISGRPAAYTLSLLRPSQKQGRGDSYNHKNCSSHHPDKYFCPDIHLYGIQFLFKPRYSLRKLLFRMRRFLIRPPGSVSRFSRG